MEQVHMKAFDVSTFSGARNLLESVRTEAMRNGFPLNSQPCLDPTLDSPFTVSYCRSL